MSNVHAHTNIIQPLLDKVLKGKSTLSIDIEGEEDSKIGVLQPLTELDLDREDIIKKLTEWRNASMSVFLTQFEATPQRTRDWLKKVVLKTPGQMLFLVYWNGIVTGHLGFKELTKSSVMLDNAIRGERAGPAKLFVYAHLALARWLVANAQVETLFGYVFADNIPAIMMNREIGWQGWLKLPLLKNEMDEATIWEFSGNEDVSPDNKYCYKLTMGKEHLIKGP